MLCICLQALQIKKLYGLSQKCQCCFEKKSLSIVEYTKNEQIHPNEMIMSNIGTVNHLQQNSLNDM